MSSSLPLLKRQKHSVQDWILVETHLQTNSMKHLYKHTNFSSHFLHISFHFVCHSSSIELLFKIPVWLTNMWTILEITTATFTDWSYPPLKNQLVKHKAAVTQKRRPQTRVTFLHNCQMQQATATEVQE